MLSYALVNVRAPLASGKSNSKPTGEAMSSLDDRSGHHAAAPPTRRGRSGRRAPDEAARHR